MRLNIRYNIGDLIKFNAGDGLWEDYAVVTKIDPWFNRSYMATHHGLGSP